MKPWWTKSYGEGWKGREGERMKLRGQGGCMTDREAKKRKGLSGDYLGMMASRARLGTSHAI
jgi:hypothetical protein